jgi:hypothetical protein
MHRSFHHRGFRSSPLALILLLISLSFTLYRLRASYIDEQKRVRFLEFNEEDGQPQIDEKPRVIPFHRPPLSKPKLAPGECIPELEYLKKKELNLSQSILHSRRCIRPIWSTRINRDDVANVSRPLFAHKLPVNLTSCSHVDFVPCDHLVLRVPPPYPERKYPEYVFGITTSYDRIYGALGPFTHWLSGSDARLVVLVIDAHYNPKANLTALSEQFASHRINASFITPHKSSYTTAQNHFAIVRDLVHEASPLTKWIGILDDDTFFPSLYSLSRTLDKYDHKVPAYLGALSEDFKAVKKYGIMAFGGAGLFISVPLARSLEPLIETCLSESISRDGDTILRDCTYNHSKARLTQVPGLFQQDMRDDPSGFFESGTRPLSLHHWRSWYKSPVQKMAAVVGLCGDCFLQRWRFGQDTIFTNGYSIAVYRDGTKNLALDKTEATWLDADPEFEFSIGPLRRKMDKTEKKTYKLAYVEVLESGAFRQVYVYKDHREKDPIDEVMELLWEG